MDLQDHITSTYFFNGESHHRAIFLKMIQLYTFFYVFYAKLTLLSQKNRIRKINFFILIKSNISFTRDCVKWKWPVNMTNNFFYYIRIQDRK
jgi:hypothetical protein